MVPLGWEATQYVLAWEDGSRRGLALNHALIHRRPGVWGDHPHRPRSVVLLRRGLDAWEAFGAGDPDPGAAWLAARRAPVVLLAPEGWADALRSVTTGLVEQERIAVRYMPEPNGVAVLPRHSGPAIATRKLVMADAATFTAATAPDATPHSWDSVEECLARGAAFGVQHGTDWLALAWITEQDHHLDAIHVHTAPRFRRLGLGRAAAGALIQYILDRRKKCPIWACLDDDDDPASRALARSLGFEFTMKETILRFGEGTLADDPGPARAAL